MVKCSHTMNKIEEKITGEIVKVSKKGPFGSFIHKLGKFGGRYPIFAQESHAGYTTPSNSDASPIRQTEGTEEIQLAPDNLVVIPSVEALWDDNQITIGGIKLADVRRRAQNEPQKEDLLKGLERKLFLARAEYIGANVESEGDRSALAEELAKETYVVASRLQYDELQDLAVSLIYQVYPNQRRAAKAIENIKLKMQLADKTPNPSA